MDVFFDKVKMVSRAAARPGTPFSLYQFFLLLILIDPVPIIEKEIQFYTNSIKKYLTDSTSTPNPSFSAPNL